MNSNGAETGLKKNPDPQHLLCNSCNNTTSSPREEECKTYQLLSQQELQCNCRTTSQQGQTVHGSDYLVKLLDQTMQCRKIEKHFYKQSSIP